MNSENFKKTVILLTEFIFVLLMFLQVLPIEAGWFLTSILIFYFLFSSLEESVWLFIASLPFFVVLSFDNFTITNWRILLLIIFLIWLIKIVDFKKTIALISKKRFRIFLSEPLIATGLVFIIIAFISLVDAPYVYIGIKKIVFLVSAFLLFLVTRSLIIRNGAFLLKIIQANKISIITVLGIGFLQLLSIFWIPLYNFWQIWASRVIPIFYGEALGELLSKSNTWFSYYASQPPTLRMFSVFPDSHSFALFAILCLPFILTPIFLGNKISKKSKVGLYFLLVFILLAIIFSGSRGTWVSAIGVLFAFLLLIIFCFLKSAKTKIGFFIPIKKESWKKQVQLIGGTLIIFFLLFPIASEVFLLSQKAQSQGEFIGTSGGVFERAKSITDTDEISAKSRLQIWEKSAVAVLEQPFLGVGIGNYPIVLGEKIEAGEKGASAHNLYLDIASETGILGLLAFLFFLLIVFKDSWHLFTKSNNKFFRVWSGFFVFSLIWLLCYSLFDVVLFNDKVLLFFMVNLGILYAIKDKEVNKF